MPPSDRVTCRVAVVDDDDYDRESVVSSLRGVLESAAIAEQVSIESFYNAHAVATRIEGSLESNPPWDIILSDVLMPHPETGKDEDRNGAFHIAKTIEGKYHKAEVPLKLAAISNNPGFLASHDLLKQFNTPSNANWFHFFVKGEGVTRARNRGHLMSEEAWERALLQLIKLRESERWGAQLLQRIDKPVVFFSAGSLAAFTKAGSIGGNKASLVVTVTGETGVGKGVIARLLHYHRMSVCRSNGQLINYPCGSSSSSFSEKELFGVKEGAYAGAIPRQGKLELAAQGSILFNQIQDLPVEIQSKLIQVIDDRKISKIGESKEIDFNGRLMVFVTTAALASKESGGSFNLELLRRMETSVINVPPLRERREDIFLLAEIFLDQLVNEFEEESRSRFEDDAKDWLVSESLLWPKNLGTLDTLIKIASDWGERRRIRRSDLEKAAKNIEGFYDESVIASPEPAEPSGLTAPKPRSRRAKIRPAGGIQKRYQYDAITNRILDVISRKHKELPARLYYVIGKMFEKDPLNKRGLTTSLDYEQVARYYFQGWVQQQESRYSRGQISKEEYQKKIEGKKQNLEDHPTKLAQLFASDLRRFLGLEFDTDAIIINDRTKRGYRIGDGWLDNPLLNAGEVTLLPGDKAGGEPTATDTENDVD